MLYINGNVGEMREILDAQESYTLDATTPLQYALDMAGETAARAHNANLADMYAHRVTDEEYRTCTAQIDAQYKAERSAAWATYMRNH